MRFKPHHQQQNVGFLSPRSGFFFEEVAWETASAGLKLDSLSVVACKQHSGGWFNLPLRHIINSLHPSRWVVGFFTSSETFQKVTEKSRWDSEFFKKWFKNVADISKVSFLALVFVFHKKSLKIRWDFKSPLIFEKLLQEFSWILTVDYPPLSKALHLCVDSQNLVL